MTPDGYVFNKAQGLVNTMDYDDDLTKKQEALYLSMNSDSAASRLPGPATGFRPHIGHDPALRGRHWPQWG